MASANRAKSMSADAVFERTQGIEETEDFRCLWFSMNDAEE